MSQTPELDSLARRINALQEQIRRANTPQLGNSAIAPDGSIPQYDENGVLRQVIGKQPDGSTGAVSFNGPNPPAPSMPTVKALDGGLRVEWDGKWAGGVYTPLDLLRIDIHLLENALDEPLLTPPVGTISAGGWGSVSVPREAGDYFAVLVAWTTSGKWSRSEVSDPVYIEDTALPPFEAPAVAPVLTVEPFAIGTVRASWPALDRDLVAQYEVATSTTSPVPTDGSATVATVPGPVFDIGATDTTYVRVRAVNSLGVGPWSAEKSATPRRANYDDLATSIRDEIASAGAAADDAQSAADQAIEDALAAFLEAQAKATPAELQAVRDLAEAAQHVADDAIRTWYQEDAPEDLNNDTDLGDLWYKESTGEAFRWAGSNNGGWRIIRDNAIGEALAAANAAQATADSKATPGEVATAKQAAIDAAKADATAKADAARQAAIDAAALDATAKAEAAEAAAAQAAALDATAKADAARAAAEQAAADYADSVAAGESGGALAAAKTYAEQMAEAARIAAESAAAADATAKAEAAESAAAQTAADDATAKANAAKQAAIDAAKADATTKANAAQSAAVAAAATAADAKVAAAKAATLTEAAATAESKAAAAKSAAEAAAKTYSDAVASGAQQAAIDAAEADATAKANAAQAAATAAAATAADAKIATAKAATLTEAATAAQAKADAALAAAKADATTKADAARQAAIDAAALDATAKAEQAEADAAATAAADATAKANAAKTAAEAAAKTYADQVSAGASGDALEAAQTYAEQKAEDARIAAEAAAALDATAKAEAAEAAAASTAAADATAKANAARDAAITAAATAAQVKADAARDAAITAAAADATAKAEAAEAAAAATASADATSKANAAKTAAEQAAKDYADTVSSGASGDALAAAKTYAETKANEARIAAENAAALDATAKAEAAEAAAAATAALDATAKANAAKQAAIDAAATTAQAKADAARDAAITAAAADATAKAEQAEADAAATASADATAKANAAKAAAEAAAKTYADTVSAGASGTALASAKTYAEQKANEARIAAEAAAALDATAKAEAAEAAAAATAALDATAKANAAQAAAEAAAAKRGRTWIQEDAPTPEVSYRWTGTPHNSRSEKLVDGEVVATNLALNPSSEINPLSLNQTTGSGSIRTRSDSWSTAGEFSTHLVKGNGYAYLITHGSTLVTPDVPRRLGCWVLTDAERIVFARRGGAGYNSAHVNVEPGVPTFVQGGWTWPDGSVTMGIDVGWENTTAPAGSYLYVDSVVVLDRAEPLTPDDYFDGDTPASVANDIWIKPSTGTPHRWDGTQWVAATDQAAIDAAAALASADATSKADAARQAAIDAAALDATAKAEAAEAAAAATAAADATSKANAAKTAAENAAKAYADTVSSGASGDALAAAKTYAEDMAEAARIAAESAAALDATAKAEAAEAAAASTAAADATTKANAAREAAKTAAATDATTKANAARDAAITAAATAAQTKADAAKDAAIAAAATAAQAKADAARDAAIAAAATDAETKAAAAETAAKSAAAADAAAKVATALATAATDAQTKANTAKSEAIAAAATDATNKANARGKVIFSSSAPPAADRQPQNLWIDTTPIGNPPAPGNVPKRWTSGTTWVAVTDKAVVDAAAAAAAAHAAANAAQGTATTALNTADGKNKTTFSASSTPPATTGRKEGDLHSKVEGSKITKQWTMVGGSWVERQIDGAVLTNLDAGSITTGFLNVALLIEAGAISTEQLAAAVIEANEIYSQDGYFGDISASQMTAGDIEAQIALFGQLLVGDYIEIDGANSSITIYADSARTQPLVQLRPDGSVFRGRIETDEMNTLGAIRLKSDKSSIDGGGGLTLKAGVSDPSAAPSIDGVLLESDFPPVPSGYTMRGMNWDSISNCWIRLLVSNASDIAGKCRVQRISHETRLVTSTVTLSNVLGLVEAHFNSIIRVGDSYYTALYYAKPNPDRMYVAKFSAINGTWQALSEEYLGSTQGLAAVGKVGANDVGLFATSDNGDLIYNHYNLTSLQRSWSGMLLPNWFDHGRSRDIMGYYEGPMVASNSVEFGKIAVMTATHVHSFDAERLWNPDMDLRLSSNVSTGGVAFKPGDWFYSYNGQRLQRYSPFVTGGQSRVGFWVGYADIGGGHTTRISPLARHEILNYRYPRATLPPAPAGVTGARPYFSLEESEPPIPGGAFFTLTTPMTTRELTLKEDAVIEMAVPPLVSTFPSGATAFIKSQDGQTAMWGDGTLEVRDPLMPNHAANKAYVDSREPEDTGWVSLSYQSGYSGPNTPGQLQYRKYGKTVYLRGGASGTFSAGTLNRVNSTLLPEDCRPSDHHRVGTFGTGVRGTVAEIRTDGQIQLGAENGVSGVGWVSACTSWLVE